MRKRALITGVTGQDGSYLSDLLLKKGYEVHGIRRRSSLFNTQRIDYLTSGKDPHESNSNFFLHYGDMTDSSNLIRLMQEVQPDEIYNLAAQSHVKVSFDSPEYTADVDGVGVLRLLEGIRILKMENKTKFYQASTSELYGQAQEIPQSERTPFYPRSPYGVAKLYGFWITVNYREAYNIFACNGILFNHESPVRGESFVTRKITKTVAKIIFGKQSKLFVGNLNSKRDWGHAKDYVEGMWLMLQHNTPGDYVLATGKTNTVRYFVEEVFRMSGIELQWVGSGVEEKGIVKKITKTSRELVEDLLVGRNITKGINLDYKIKEGDILVEIDPKYYRPTEVDILIGDSTKAKDVLGWEPKYNINMLIKDMVTFDIKEVAKEIGLLS